MLAVQGWAASAVLYLDNVNGCFSAEPNEIAQSWSVLFIVRRAFILPEITDLRALLCSAKPKGSIWSFYK